MHARRSTRRPNAASRRRRRRVARPASGVRGAAAQRRLARQHRATASIHGVPPNYRCARCACSKAQSEAHRRRYVASAYVNVAAMIFLSFASLLLTSAPAEIAIAIAAQQLPPSAVSFIVADVETGRPVISQNAQVPRSPASTIKAVTTYASLDLLGPAYTWHTRALAGGPIEAGVLNGDLILQGGGDPYMTLERWWSFANRRRGRGRPTTQGNFFAKIPFFSLPGGNRGAFDAGPI